MTTNCSIFVNANQLTMKKSIIFFAILFFAIASVSAQSAPVVQRGVKGLYIVHTVTPKQTFYSVGRLYNVAAKDIAVYNGLDMSHGLVIGKTIMIPLTAANFSQELVTSHPVYYVVGAKETLFRVGYKNNNVPLASIRKWNNLTNDKIAPGQKLIVGYLVSNTTNALAVQTQREEQAVSQLPKTELKEAPQEPSQVVSAPKEEPVKQVSHVVASTESGLGFFKEQFILQTKAEGTKADITLTAGTFKTSSGWQDAKFYALIDNAEPGTIVKIVNPNNNKAVYAKVLDKMSGIRQNQGFDLRISNAAANALGVVEEDKFFVRVVY